MSSMVQETKPAVAAPELQSAATHRPGARRPWFTITIVVALSILFARPLFGLARLALANDLYSHILLVPFVTLYLIWLKRSDFRGIRERVFCVSVAIVPAAVGMLALSVYLFTPTAWRSVPENSLSLLVLSYVCFVCAVIVAGLGWDSVRRILFPMAFLIFLAPFPVAVTHWIETGLQYASAEAASLMLSISQTSVLRDGLFFKLPGITLEVAQECSGVRSTLVLFITSLVGAYLFLQSKTHRALFVLAVVPIAIVRNGLRIFTIALLCIHIDPDMIHSWIHRRGGPVFFLLSLVPLLALLLLFCWRERKQKPDKGSASINTAKPTPALL